MNLRGKLLLFCALTFASGAEARLGETMAELTARFGKDIRTRKAKVFVGGNQREVETLVIFHYEEWRIDAVMIDNLCLRIRYAKSARWTEEQIDTLLKNNAADFAWKEEVTTPDRKWTRSDGATATWSKSLGLTLELSAYAQRLNGRKVSNP